jgi:hypothetical protein
MPSLSSAGKIEQVEAGIDWITWVAPRDGQEGRLERLGARLVESQRERGANVKPLRIEGYAGIQAGQCAYGFRKDSAYLRTSGSLAESQWSSIASCGGHPTRVDVQTTFLLSQPHNGFGSRVWRERTAQASHRRGRPLTRSVSQANTGLWCGTVGTRTSRSFLRVYDKGIESGSHPRGQRWRIELEAKKDLARILFAELQASPNATQWCLDCCQRACNQNLCTWPAAKNESLSPIPAMAPRELAEVAATLKWLESIVRPSVERLVPHVGVDALLRVLGLDAYAEAYVTSRGQE